MCNFCEFETQKNYVTEQEVINFVVFKNEFSNDYNGSDAKSFIFLCLRHVFIYFFLIFLNILVVSLVCSPMI